MSGERVVRSVEVRPSWSASEWAQIAGAADSAGVVPATWTGEVLTAVLGEGPAPARYTRRGDLWRGLLERWQSVFWAYVALKPDTQGDASEQVADTIARGGAVLVSQVEQITDLERRRCREVIGAVTGMVDMLGPRTRRRAAGKTDGHPRDGRHRAKLLLTTAAHNALARACEAGGWAPSDYAGAAVATAATLTLTDTRAPAEVALLLRCQDLVRATATRLAVLVANDQSLTGEQWDAVATDLAAAEALLGQAQAARGPAEAILDVRAAVPGVFLTLGWAAQWAVSRS
jgi:hypothetical protein